MWIFTQHGFVSAVEKDGSLQIRSRDRESLKSLGFGRRRIKTGRGTDYPFRVYSTHEELKRILAKQVDEIHYENFKTQAHKVRGKTYASALGSVWTAMLRMEPPNVIRYLGDSWRKPTKRSRRSDYPTRSTHGSWANSYSQLGLDELPGEEFDELLPLTHEEKRLHEMTDEEWATYCEKIGIE